MTTDWQAWQQSWDRQQEVYLPDREQRFEVMLDVVEAVVGAAPRALDLACGTGSISIRLLKRFQDARAVCVDVDPALLRRLYADVASVLRPGGVFCNADHMPDRPAKELDTRLEALPPVDWHLEALRAGGFRETTVAWRRYGDAVVVGLR